MDKQYTVPQWLEDLLRRYDDEDIFEQDTIVARLEANIRNMQDITAKLRSLTPVEDCSREWVTKTMADLTRTIFLSKQSVEYLTDLGISGEDTIAFLREIEFGVSDAGLVQHRLLDSVYPQDDWEFTPVD